MLANGAVGIDFHHPMSGKPANLQNSAVLRMLEEEESRQRNGQSPGFRSDGSKPLCRAWPPPGVNNQRRRFQDAVISGVKRVAWPPPKEGEDEYSEQEAVQAQGGPQYSSQAPNSISPINHHIGQRPLSSGSSASPGCSPQPQQAQQPAWAPQQQFNSQHNLLLQQVPKQQPQPAYSPVSAPFQQGNIRPQSPQPFNQLQQQQQQPLWAPVQTPQSVTSPKPQQQQQPPQFQAQPQQQVQPTLYQPPVKQFEPPPTIITLRPEVPISQAPAPIVTSQPATATLKGGKNLRGDLKWPPENVRDRMNAENQLRMELAQGPSVRPRKVAKDYSSFFAQHALNSSYPGYKIPPGTQYYEHHPVM